jgi:hypothetical protein
MDIAPITAHTPARWVLCFSRVGLPWVPGYYKHVRAYGYLPGIRSWLFYDCNLTGRSVSVAPDSDDTVRTVMWAFVRDCDIISMPAVRAGTMPWLTRLGWWCVPDMKSLIGLRSRAITPDGLYRDCLRAEGALRLTPAMTDVPANGTGRPAIRPAAARPCAASLAGPGPAAA